MRPGLVSWAFAQKHDRMDLCVFLLGAAEGPAVVFGPAVGVGQAWAWPVSQMQFRWEQPQHRARGLPAQQLMGQELGTARAASPLEEIFTRKKSGFSSSVLIYKRNFCCSCLLKHCKETSVLVVSVVIQEPDEMPFSTKMPLYLFVI